MVRFNLQRIKSILGLKEDSKVKYPKVMGGNCTKCEKFIPLEMAILEHEYDMYGSYECSTHYCPFCDDDYIEVAPWDISDVTHYFIIPELNV